MSKIFYKYKPLSMNWDLEAKENILQVRIIEDDYDVQFTFRCGENVDEKKAIEIFERDKKESLLGFVKMQSNDWWELNE